MMRWGMVVLAVLTAGQGCGGSTGPNQCIELTTHFSPAAVSVDPNKQMADLTIDERASVCAEFTRALNASFGTVELECKFGSHAGNRMGMPTCPAWYDECLQAAAPDMITYCTDKMSGMWSCPVTIGQYQACFNDLHTVLLTAIEVAPACGQAEGSLCMSALPSCDAAPCDYTWFD